MPNKPLRLSLIITLLSVLSGTAGASSEELFTLSLEELLQIEINVSGQAVAAIDLALVPETANGARIAVFDMPATLESVSRQTMEARGMRNVIEVVESVTGVSSGESPSEPYSFSMRGFDRASVKVLYDGISMGAAILNMRPLGTNNLERVEVVKGPYALEQESAAAGTINMITRKPELRDTHIGKALVSYGSFNSYSLSADATGPVNKHAAYLVNFERRSSDGWVDNTHSEFLNINTAGLWQINPTVQVGASLAYFEDELPGYWGTPLVPREFAFQPIDDVVATDTNEVIDGATLDTNYNVSDQLSESRSYWVNTHLSWQVTPALHSRTRLYQFRADREWRNAESYIYEPDTNSIVRDRLLVTHDRNLIGLKSDWLLEHALVGRNSRSALSIEWSDNRFDREVGFDADSFFVDAVDYIQPQSGFFNNSNISYRDDHYRETSAALVLENTTQLSPVLVTTLGGRANYLDYETLRYNFDAEPTLTQRDNLKLYSYHAGINYRVATSTTVYGHYAQQQDNLQYALRSFDSSDTARFEPPTVNQAEIGIKSNFWRERINLTWALYDIHKEAVGIAASQHTKNTQNAKGFDFSIKVQMSEQIKFGGNFARVTARYDSYYDTAFARDVSGKTPINAPENSFSVWAGYNQLFNLPLEFVVNIKAVDSHYANTSNTVSHQDYRLSNAFLAYTGKKYRVALHGRNLTDEVYVPFSEPFYPTQVMLGAPRSLELSMRVAF